MPARSEEQVRRQLEAERRELVEAVDELKTEARSKLPVVAAGAAAAVFVLGGGLKGTVKLLWRAVRR
jgi:hypothetical protein